MLKKTSLFMVLVFLVVYSGIVKADCIFLGPDSFQRPNLYTYAIRDTSKLTVSDVYDFYELSSPILLPDGAKITSMVVFHYDNNSDSRISVSIIRENRYGNSTQTIIPQQLSTDSTTDPQITKSTNVNWAYNKILTSSCTYHVILQFEAVFDIYDYSNLRFYGIKIFYKAPIS